MSDPHLINEAHPISSQNLQKVCRLCLSEESLEDIFLQNGLPTWISELLAIVVSQSDKISHWICVLCRIRLQDFRDYRLRCSEVQQVLLSESDVTDGTNLPNEGERASEAGLLIPTATEDESSFSLEIRKNDISIGDSFEVECLSNEDEEEDIYNITLRSPQEVQLVCLNTPDNPEKLRTAKTKPAHKRGYKGRHITCNICGKVVQKLRFDSHMNAHLGLRPYKCERGCKEEYFACKYKLHEHYRKVHEGFKHECGICDRSFGTRQGLFSHKQRHHTINSRKCNICDQIFSSESLWKRHSIIHQASSNVSSLSVDSNLSYNALYENFGKTIRDG